MDKTIILNGVKVKVPASVTYDELVDLAYPNRNNRDRVYTAVFDQPNGHGGSLIRGLALKAEDGTKVNIHDTSNA